MLMVIMVIVMVVIMLVVRLVVMLGLLVIIPTTLLSLAFLSGPSMSGKNEILFSFLIRVLLVLPVTFLSSFPLLYDLENPVIVIAPAAVIIILVIVVVTVAATSIARFLLSSKTGVKDAR